MTALGEMHHNIGADQFVQMYVYYHHLLFTDKICSL